MSGIYIHIPFCKKRCNYCDFYLITNLNAVDRFLSSLEKEIEIYSEELKNEEFETIFFGGGTPSILIPAQLDKIINNLHKHFKISSSPEITIEANPEDFEKKKFADYKAAGVNRLSFGVQSFIDSELKFLTRQHSAEEAEAVIREATKMFDNVSLDIIYSLPGQSQNDLDRSLTKAIDCGIRHISAYTLTYEERTPLHKQFVKNPVIKNSDSAEADLYEFVSARLRTGGFDQYEVSNFAMAGFRSKHNMKYWHYENYIGLGPSSHSFFKKKRWNNFRDIIKYNTMLSGNQRPVENSHVLSTEEMKLEYIMLSLRSTGLEPGSYRSRFQNDFEKEYGDSISQLIQSGFASNDKGLFRLNAKGYAVADGIIAKYF